MLNKSELFKVSKILKDGHYGSFMAAIGDALQLADSDNAQRLYEAFGDKFEAIYANYVKSQEIKIANRQLSEDEIQAIVEDRIVCLHDKLIQGQITKIEYDKEVSIVDKWAIQQANA